MDDPDRTPVKFEKPIRVFKAVMERLPSANREPGYKGKGLFLLVSALLCIGTVRRSAVGLDK